MWVCYYTRMRYLGIDYGTKKTGLALSDEAGTMGFPKAVVPTDATLAERLAALIAQEGVGAVVIGESKDFSGADNPIAEAARALGKELAAQAGVPVFYEPETLTTQEARRLPTGERMSGIVDASAAALILTSYLTRQNGREAVGS